MFSLTKIPSVSFSHNRAAVGGTLSSSAEGERGDNRAVSGFSEAERFPRVPDFFIFCAVVAMAINRHDPTAVAMVNDDQRSQ